MLITLLIILYFSSNHSVQIDKQNESQVENIGSENKDISDQTPTQGTEQIEIVSYPVSYSDPKQEAKIFISSKILADNLIEQIDSEVSRFSNINFENFSFNFSHEIWNETSAIKTDDRVDLRMSIQTSLLHKSTGDKLDISFYIPGAIGWNGPFACYQNIETLTKLHDGVVRLNLVDRTVYTSNIMLKDEFKIKFPDSKQIPNSNVSITDYYVLDNNGKRIEEPTDFAYCLGIGPSFITDSTINTEHTIKDASAFSQDIGGYPLIENMDIVFDIKLSSYNHEFIKDVDEVLGTLQY